MGEIKNYTSHLFFLGALLFLSGLLTITVHTQDTKASTAYDRFAHLKVLIPFDNPTLEGRKAAIAEAHVEALSLWIESLPLKLSARTRERLLARIDHYLISSEIISERAVAGRGELGVGVYLNQDLARLDIASELFPKRAIKSSAVVMMGQNFFNEQYTVRLNDVGPDMMVRLFEDTGFIVTSQAEIDTRFTTEEVERCIRSGAKQAAKYARAMRADVVILGEVRSGTVDEEGAVGKIRAYADVMVVRASDGLLLDRIQEEAVVAGENSFAVSRMAAEDAVYKLQQRVLVAAILGVLSDSSSTLTHFVVRGENVKRISGDVERYLRGIDQIDSLELLHRERNLLTFDLSFSGKMGGLVNAIEQVGDSAFRLQSVTVVKGEMLFELSACQ